MPAPTICSPGLDSGLSGPELPATPLSPLSPPPPPPPPPAPSGETDLSLTGETTPQATEEAANESSEGEGSRARSRGRSRLMNYRLKWPRCVLVDSATTVYGNSASETSSVTSSAGEAVVSTAKRRGRKRKHPEKPTAAAFPDNGDEDFGVLSSADSSFNASFSSGRRTKRRRKMLLASAAAAAALAGAGVVAKLGENLDPLAVPPPASARLPNLHGVVRQLEQRLAATRPFSYAWDEEARAASDAVDARREAYRVGLQAAAAAAKTAAAANGNAGRRRRSVGRPSRASIGEESASAGVSPAVPLILATKASGRGEHAVLVAWD